MAAAGPYALLSSCDGGFAAEELVRREWEAGGGRRAAGGGRERPRVCARCEPSRGFRCKGFTRAAGGVGRLTVVLSAGTIPLPAGGKTGAGRS